MNPAPNHAPADLLNVEQCAELLGVSMRTVHRLRARKKIEPVRVNNCRHGKYRGPNMRDLYFRRADIEQLCLTSNRTIRNRPRIKLVFLGVMDRFERGRKWA